MAESHIHTPIDGRGIRRVLLDGVEVKAVVWANTQTGDVTFIPEPFRVEFGELFTCTLRGVVVVEPK